MADSENRNDLIDSGAHDARAESDAKITTGNGTLRLLVPVDATADWRNAIQYVRARMREGRNVDVRLLHVTEPVEDWQALRFPTEQEIADHQTGRGELLLQDAARAFASVGATQRSYCRQGDFVFLILDLAEELSCDAIILPIPPALWRALGVGRVARSVRRRERAIPVITLDRSGKPVTDRRVR